MKKFLLTMIVTMLSCIGAWAERVTISGNSYTELSNDGKTLTVYIDNASDLTESAWGYGDNSQTPWDEELVTNVVLTANVSVASFSDNILYLFAEGNNALESIDMRNLSSGIITPLVNYGNGLLNDKISNYVEKLIFPDSYEIPSLSELKAKYSSIEGGSNNGGSGDTPGGSETPDDTRTIELRHAGDLLGDVINVPLGSDYQFTVQGFNFQGDYLETKSLNVENSIYCSAACPSLGDAKYGAQTVTVTPNSNGETGTTTITITLKGSGDAAPKSVTLTVNVYDPTVASSFSIYPASPITVDKGSTTDVEVRIEPASATFELSAVTGLAGVTAEIVDVAGKKYVRINTSAAESTGTATFTLSPNGLSSVEVTVNVVAPRVPVTASCPEIVRFGQNNLSASAVLGVDEADKENYTISYSTSNSAILNVDAATGVLTPVALGNATITVTVTPEDSEAEYAEFTQDFPVTVAKGQYTFTVAADPAFFVVEEGGTSTLSYTNVQLNGVDATTGFEVTYSPKASKAGVSIDGNTVTIASSATAGTFTAIATLTPANTTNYEVAIKEVDITIGEPGFSFSLGDKTMPRGTNAYYENFVSVVDADFNAVGTTFTPSVNIMDESIVTADFNVGPSYSAITFHPTKAGETDVVLTVQAKTPSGKTTSAKTTIRVTVTAIPLTFTVGSITVNDDQALTVEVIKSAVEVKGKDQHGNNVTITSGYNVEVEYNDELVSSIPAQGSGGDYFNIKVFVKATDTENYADAEEPKDATVTVTHLKSFDLALNADKTSIMDNGQKATIDLASTCTEDEVTTDVAISSYDMTYTLSEAGVATVNKDGNTITVTGQKPGTVTVTVTAHPTDGSAYATVTNSTTITVTESQKVYLTTETIDGKDYVVVNVPEGGAFGGISDDPKLDLVNSTVSLADLKAAKNVKVKGNISNSDVQELVNLLGYVVGNEVVPSASNCVVLDMGSAKMTEQVTASTYKCSWVNDDNRKSLGNVKNLTLPQPADGFTVLPSNACSIFAGWNNSSVNSLETLTIPEGWTETADYFSCYDGSAQTTLQKLTTLNLPNSLERIGAYSFADIHVETLYMPKNIKYIGAHAFVPTSYLKDIYFTGDGTALKYVDKNAFSTQTYLCNNSVNDAGQNDKQMPTINRGNYTNGGVPVCIMHYPKGCDAEYTDVTRKYTVLDTDNIDNDPEHGHYPNYDKGNYVYTPSGTYENGDAWVWDESFKTTVNDNRDGSSYQMETLTVDGAFPDDTYGYSFIWPSQSQMTYGYAIAHAGYLWNMQPMSKDQLDPENGVDKRGLYQFIIGMGNAPSDKDEWVFPTQYDMDKWYTLAVPFDMSIDQIHNVFGTETQVCRISKVTRDTSGDEKKLVLEFRNSVMHEDDGRPENIEYHDGETNQYGIRHHWPYMIKPGKSVDELQAEFQENGYRKLPNYQTIPGNLMIETMPAVDNDGNSVGKNYLFSPILMEGKIKKNSYVLVNKGNGVHLYSFYKGADDGNGNLVDGGRASANTAYVQIAHGEQDLTDFFTDDSTEPGTNVGSKVRFSSFFGDLFEDDDETTRIDKIEIVCGDEEIGDDKIYTINGILVSGKSLVPGLYIKNGKKFIVK